MNTYVHSGCNHPLWIAHHQL